MSDALGTEDQLEVKAAAADFDVIVIGAGVGGLCAAARLVEAGKRVVVLEGRDRVGGRLLSHVAGPSPRFDLGATWFWPSEPRVMRLIAELDIAVFPHYRTGDAMYHDPSGSRRIDGNALSSPSGRFVDGADSLTMALAEQLPPQAIRLNHVVESIDATRTKLAVATGTATFTARQVVLAVPPALAVSTISFLPPLPERVRAVAATTPVWMGAITKVVVRYQRPFWRDVGLAGSAISHYGPMRELHDMSGPEGSAAALFGFVPAIPGAPTVTEDAIAQQLVEIFGPSAAEPAEIIIHDWRDEPLTSPPNVEQLTAYELFGHEIYTTPTLDGRLHWASTETASHSPGHIEGAISAAYRAVDAVLAGAEFESSPITRSTP